MKQATMYNVRRGQGLPAYLYIQILVQTLGGYVVPPLYIVHAVLRRFLKNP